MKIDEVKLRCYVENFIDFGDCGCCPLMDKCAVNNVEYDLPKCADRVIDWMNKE